MAKIYVKKKWKSAVAGILAAVVILGAVVGLTSLLKRDTSVIGPSSFSVGGISAETGKGVETKISVSSKNRFACQGLSIIPDFGCSSTYQVFFYNEDDVFLGATEKRSDEFKDSDIPAAGHYARIVIYPSTFDENGNKINDFSVKFWEVSGIVKDFTITVSKSQETADLLKKAVEVEYSENIVLPPAANILVSDAKYDVKVNSWEGIVEVADSSVFCGNVKALSQVKLSVFSENDVTFIFLNNTGNFVDLVNVRGGDSLVCDVGSASFVLVNLTEDVEVSVLEYMPR